MVLIVDDEVGLCTTLRIALEMQGVPSRIASSVEAAREEMKKSRPRLLICDINMPKQDGFVLVEEVRQNADFMDLPVLMMTGLHTQEYSEKARKLGVLELVSKPFELEKMLSLISENIGKE